MMQQSNQVRWNIRWRTVVLMILPSLCPPLIAQAGQWVWMGGSSRTVTQTKSTNVPEIGPPGVYGTLGTPASGNTPGARKNAITWTDSSGNLWLFGGGADGYGHDGPVIFNDIWRFSPSTREWAWMGGSDKSGCKGCGQAGIYGTLGTAASTNVPGSRAFAISWTDSDSNFWLYGGGGYDAAKNMTTLSDLWEFDPSTREWTWMGGSTTLEIGRCDSLGTPDAGNTPGFREFSSSWIDSTGNVWLFGGWGMSLVGPNQSTGSGDLNDLWKYDPSTGEWACMAASTRAVNERGDKGIPGVYATLGGPHEQNVPGGRENASGWTDKEGNLWLFGGQGRDSNDTMGYLNDLWEFDPSIGEWAWIGGGSGLPCRTNEGCGLLGVYGKIGKPSAKIAPGGGILRPVGPIAMAIFGSSGERVPTLRAM